MNLKLIATSAVCAALIAGCAAEKSAAGDASSTTEETMLTILTSDDPETQLMALVLTNAVKAKEESPRILLCSAAGDLALASPKEAAVAPLQPKGVSPQGLLKKLMSDGVPVDVCAIYLPNRPFDQTALIDGVGVATLAAMGEAIAQPGEKIMSF